MYSMLRDRSFPATLTGSKTNFVSKKVMFIFFNSQQKLHMGRLRPEVQPFTLLYTILHMSRNFYKNIFVKRITIKNKTFFVLQCIESFSYP